MAISIIPNSEVITVGNQFYLRPNPSTTPPLGNKNPRSGLLPWLYETINPSLTITVTTDGVCYGLVPDIILSAEIKPGNSAGIGCSVLSGGLGNIPEFSLPKFSAPLMKYGKYPGNGTNVLPMINPLIGMYTEKYFYDQEYIWAEYYKNTDNVVKNQLKYLDLINGTKTRDIDLNEEKLERISKDDFSGAGTPIDLTAISIDDTDEALTNGSPYLDRLTKNVTAWVKFKPSFITVMRYYYTITVTHTCPPFTTDIYGYMDVSNNWSTYPPRLTYYINKGVGVIDNTASTNGST